MFTVVVHQCPVRVRGIPAENGRIAGGVYYPAGPGKPVDTVRFTPSGTIRFDPDTGVRETVVHYDQTWGEGLEFSRVQLVERPHFDSVVTAVWVSLADVDGVVHTREFPVTGGMTAEYGPIRVEVSRDGQAGQGQTPQGGPEAGGAGG